MQHNAGDNRTSKALWDRTSVLSCCSRLTPGSSRRPFPASTNAESVPADSVRTAKSVVPMLLREALRTTRRVSGRSAFSEVRRLLDCRARQAGKGEHGREHKHTRPKCSVSKRKAEYVHMVRKVDATVTETNKQGQATARAVQKTAQPTYHIHVRKVNTTPQARNIRERVVRQVDHRQA